MLISTAAIANEGSRDPAIWLGESAIHYRGPITKAGTKDLRITYSSARDPIQWLEITSNGGEVNASMDLGDWVYANNINVRVIDHCLSACANYVFPAGSIKAIEPGAIVAWHGSAIQSEEKSRKEISTVIERDVLPGTPQSDRAVLKTRLLDDTLAYLHASWARQAQFFAKIDVDERLTTIGEDHKDVRDFWFLSPAAMKRLGLRSVIAPPDYSATDTSRFGDQVIRYIEIDF
ncbi:MAG: hypothetical protein ACI8XZ_004367 [Gammaproteobacteria bacterium]